MLVGITALLATAATVSAHGFVQTVTSGSTTYDGYNPNVHPYQQNPVYAGWAANNGDLGFVEPNAAGTPDVICHKAGRPGSQHVVVQAGQSITLQWNTWPGDSHKGPIIDYLARCSGSCSTVDKTSLRFFKIAQQGLISPNNWATDVLGRNSNRWTVRIPSSLQAGNYVLRHEIIALHSGASPNGAQLYPQCINIQVTGGGSSQPSGTPGTSLYRATDPGILHNIYTSTTYPIPGPSMSNISKREHVRDFKVEVSESKYIMDQMNEKPVPRQPNPPEKVAQVKTHNRRREYLERHPSYFENREHELAGCASHPVLYAHLIKQFQTPAERAAEGKAKGYGLTLEADLLRGESKMFKLSSTTTGRDTVTNTQNSLDAKLDESWDQPAADRAQGQQLWRVFLSERFILGDDEDFDYTTVDGNEEYDMMERQDEEEKWYDEEEPGWEAGASSRYSETGVQDF
ncbi:hypothetical protein S40293_02168 [Stachybotrys chartarum IBT 40293]|nr:hypothetical protein S40293_02168 [Stachybotrys chartarum IBT 40293]